MIFNRTKHSQKPVSPPAADPPVLTRAEFDKLMKRLTQIESSVDLIGKRSIRTESKVQRLMEHHGLDGHGKPISSVN